MKILQINKFFYMRGGAERHYFDLMALLEEHGHEVIPFSMQDPRNEQSPYTKYFVSHLELSNPGLASLVSLGRFFYSREAARKLEALIDATKPDVAHVHLIYHQLSPSILDVLRKKNIPVVFTIHDWKLLCPNYMMYAHGEICHHCLKKDSNPFSTIAHRCVKNSYALSTAAALEAWVNKKRYTDGIDALIAPSHFVRDCFVDAGWPAKKIHTLYHFLPSVPTPSASSDAQNILYAGRLSEEKGVQFLVETWVKQKLPYTLVVAGTGPLEEKLKKIAGQRKKSPITFVGFLSEKELEKQLRQSALVVVPSLWYETFGLVSVEAMSYGVPVVTTSQGAQQELVDVSGGGATFPVGDEQAFADTINMLMKDPEKRRQLGAAGRAFVKKELDKESYYRQLMKIYTGLVKKS